MDGHEATYSVSALCEEVREIVRRAPGEVWVAGEIQRLKPGRGGHLYFELVEKGDADEIVGRLDAVLWRTQHGAVRRLLARTGQELAEGSHVRCRARFDLYPPSGRLRLTVQEVDPEFSLGRLEARRRETREALRRAGLLELNAGLALAPVPLDVALVTAVGSAAYHDFLAGLSESGWGFRVTAIDAAVQGAAAERSLATALAAAGRLPVDVVVLIRGGGSRSDLAAFDSRRVAEAVARCPCPVLTGLGHEIDRSIADEAAHTAVKTPTKVAELLVERVTAADRTIGEAARDLGRASHALLERGRRGLVRGHRALGTVRSRLATGAARLREVAERLGGEAQRQPRRSAQRLEALRGRLAAAGPRAARRQTERPERLRQRLAASARSRLARLTAVLDGWERLRRQLGPERILARGFSLTRREDGRVLRRAAEARPGERLTTSLADGKLSSRVEAS